MRTLSLRGKRKRSACIIVEGEADGAIPGAVTLVFDNIPEQCESWPAKSQQIDLGHINREDRKEIASFLRAMAEELDR